MNIVNRAKNLILNPRAEWEIIRNEDTSHIEIVTRYMLILALIPTLSQLIKYGFIGFRLPFGAYHTGILPIGVRYASITFISSVLGVYISAFIVDFLAPNFESPRNFIRALQLVVYSFTPYFVFGIFNLIPGMEFLTLFGLYGMYLFYYGIGLMLLTPVNRITSYFVVSTLVTIAVYMVLRLILSHVFILDPFTIPVYTV